jgi:hypothetical protein
MLQDTVDKAFERRKRVHLLPPRLSGVFPTIRLRDVIHYGLYREPTSSRWTISIIVNIDQLGSIETGRREDCATLWVQRQL